MNGQSGNPFESLDAAIEEEFARAKRRLNRAGLLGPQDALDAHLRNAWVGLVLTVFGAAGLAAALAVERTPGLVVSAALLAAVGVVGLLISIGAVVGHEEGSLRVAYVIDDLYRPADPAQWANLPTPPDGHGHLYAIQFATGVVKAGQTNNPSRRLNEHRRNATAFNVPMTRVWISPAHADYLANEVQLLAAIAGDHDGDRARREYFHDADFDRIVEIARGLLPPVTAA